MGKSKEKTHSDNDSTTCCFPPLSKKKESNKKEKAMRQFLTEVLPSLKKELNKQKKVVFSWNNYAAYFKPENNYLATYLIPLLRFINKTSIICTRYGCFDGKHRVKTAEGFDKVVELTKSDIEDKSFNAEMQRFITQKFGREWYKIPSRDGHKAKLAFESSPDGRFLITIVACTEDYFYDQDTGQKILTINPVLIYEPVIATTSQTASSSSQNSGTSKKPKKAKNTSPPPVSPPSEEITFASNTGDIDSQDTAIELLKDYEQINE